MKSIICTICLLFVSLSFAIAQNCNTKRYDELVKGGNIALDSGKFVEAIEYYNSAKDYCPQKSKETDKMILGVVQKIQELKQIADENLQKANKLINAFYFYDDKFALAFKGDRFYFIDKNGDKVEKLGEWERAEMFDRETGFAKVKEKEKNQVFDFLLDTLGNKYRVAYRIESLNSETKALDLTGIYLDSFPISVLENTQLEVLIINGDHTKKNNFKLLPLQINNLKNLKVLHLTNFQPNSFPIEILELKSLTILNLSSNRLVGLPSSINKLENLTQLKLYNNRLEKLPKEIAELKRLTNLNLGGNLLKELPVEFERLKNLTSLNLEINLFPDFPTQITTLENLTHLYLAVNSFNKLPNQISNLKNLIKLYLSTNEINTLPNSIGRLINLKELDLSQNELVTVPIQIKELKKLKKLLLDYNPILNKEQEEIKKLLPNCEIGFSKEEISISKITIRKVLNEGDNEFYEENYEKALEYYLKALQIDSLESQAIKQAGICYRFLGDNEKSIKYLKRHLELSSSDASIFRLFTLRELSLTYAAMGDYKNAYLSIKKAIELRISDYSSWFNLSFYALFVGKPQEAIEAAKKTLELNSEAVSVETNLALGYLLNNQWSEAEKTYLKWKGKKFPDDDLLCDEVFLADIADLEKVGITHSDFEKVKKLFEKKK